MTVDPEVMTPEARKRTATALRMRADAHARLARIDREIADELDPEGAPVDEGWLAACRIQPMSQVKLGGEWWTVTATYRDDVDKVRLTCQHDRRITDLELHPDDKLIVSELF